MPSYDAWLETIHPNDRVKTAQTVLKAAASNSELTIEWRVNTKDGSEEGSSA